MPVVLPADTDTVTTVLIPILKGGESLPFLPPTQDSLPLDTLREMPKQGPSQATTATIDSVRGCISGPPVESAIDIVVPNAAPLQRITPGYLLQPGQWEARIYQQVYSQTHYFDSQGKPQPQNFRSSYYTGIASWTIGCNRWLNLGAEAWIRAVHLGAESSSPFAVLGFRSDALSRAALTAIGPRLKVMPWSRLPGLTAQTSLLIPIGRDLEGLQSGRPYLATQFLQWWTQFYYRQWISHRWQLFVELDAFAALRTRGVAVGQRSWLATPLSAYLSYFPTHRLTFFAMNQVWPAAHSIWYQAGLGGKLLISSRFEIELMYGRFLAGVNAAGQANAFNLGMRLVKW